MFYSPPAGDLLWMGFRVPCVCFWPVRPQCVWICGGIEGWSCQPHPRLNPHLIPGLSLALCYPLVNLDHLKFSHLFQFLVKVNKNSTPNHFRSVGDSVLSAWSGGIFTFILYLILPLELYQLTILDWLLPHCQIQVCWFILTHFSWLNLIPQLIVSSVLFGSMDLSVQHSHFLPFNDATGIPYMRVNYTAQCCYCSCTFEISQLCLRFNQHAYFGLPCGDSEGTNPCCNITFKYHIHKCILQCFEAKEFCI
jgi:hypothetical protein